MKNKILTLFIFGIFLFSLTSVLASPDTTGNWGTVKQGDAITITQTCASSTYVTLATIQTPNRNTDLINTNMTYVGAGSFQYNYTTTDLGRYDVCFISDGCESQESCGYFEVTPSGKTSSTGESILYFLLTMIIFLLFGTMIYFIVMIDSQNYYDNESQTFGINKMKYIKILLIGFTYPVLIILLNLMNGLAVNFTSLTIFSGTIGFLFEMLLRLAWVWSIIIMAWLVVRTVKDTNFKRLMTVEGYQFVK